MENENEEDIIDSDQNDQNDDANEDLDNQSDDQNSDDNQDEGQDDDGQSDSDDNENSDDNKGGDDNQDGKKKKAPEQKTETDEAKRARLKRQLERQERKMGILPEKKQNQEQKQSSRTASLSPSETIAIIEAKVHSEDVDTVVKYAEFNKISVIKALKDDILINTLKIRNEKRASANATNTGRARNGSSRATGETLLKKAQEKGEIPNDPGALDAMLDERFKARG